ncbi:MAG TPA: ABC transporter permease [Planctomycetota bacterium]|nr:ABC transporter permease [Planctomycetota bacterium]
MSGKLAALASLAVDNVAAHAQGSAASAAGLALTLLLWIAGASVAEGLREEALRAVAASPDVVIAAMALGRHAPLEPALAERVRALPGVESVEGRIVASVDAGPEKILVVGVEAARLRGVRELARGVAPREPNECVVGAELAQHLGLGPGSHLALEGALTRVVRISGVLARDDAIAGSKALVLELAQVQELLGDARISELCVATRAGYAEAVARAAERQGEALVATTRSAAQAAVEHAARRRSAGLSGLLAPLLALACASFAALAWFASARRATEIAAYKLTGFTGGDLLLLGVVENALVALVIGCSAFLGAWFFVRVLGAPLLAPYLVPDLELFPTQRIPATFTPLPLGIGLALAFTTTLAGSIFGTWRASLARTSKAFA